MKEKEQKRLDKVLDAAQQAVPEEVSALIGATLKISNSSYKLINKEDVFDSLTSKQVLSKMDVRGDLEGDGCLLVSVKAAIRLGGTLIMLPAAELDEVVAAETYTDETEDSYGEIANIIAGAYSKTFEDLYPKNCRLIRKEQSIISPAKIDIESDDPVADQMYYVVTQDISLDDKEMGQLNLLLPAITFDLIEEGEAGDAVVEDVATDTVTTEATNEQVGNSEAGKNEIEETNNSVEEKKASVLPYDPKNLPRIDKVLDAAQQAVPEEVSALIGATLKISNSSYQLKNKEDAFDSLSSKQILSKMDVRGDIEGDGCLLVSVKAAIRLGGTLIMLPAAELDDVVAAETYTDETEDSYGEIANIIAGAYSKSFEDLYPKNCRLIRKEQTIISPAKIDIESDDPVVDQMYYVVTQDMSLDDKEMGELHLLLPATTFGLVEEKTSGDVVADKAVGETDISQEGKVENSASDNKETEVSSEVQEETALVAAYNPKNLPKIDKILEAAQTTLCEEVSGLIGAELKITGTTLEFHTKEEIFDDLNSKQIAAKIDIRGDVEGEGGLFVSLKGAIRLGGTLIMLPQTELEESIGREDYNEETEDSFGEIANIIAGSYSKVLEDMYPKNCRLIRKEQSLISPAKVDISSNEPIIEQVYYVAKSSCELDGANCGEMVMALPAITFGILEADVTDVKETSQAGITPKSQNANSESANEQSHETAEQPTKPVLPKFDSDKQKERVDKLLATCKDKIKEEVGAMLGVEVNLESVENKLTTKEDFFFDEASGKQVMALCDVVGDEEDKSFFFVGLKDAVRIGGILIMLPPSELETAVSEEEYTEDTQDAYGEIANIISGVYTAVFEENYTKKLRFIRKELETVVPMKVEIESDEPVPDQLYYLHALNLTIGDKELGKMQMLFPATLLQLERLGEVEEVIEEVTSEDSVESSSATSTQESSDNNTAASQGIDQSETEQYDVIVIGNDEHEKSKLQSVIEEKGMKVRNLTFKENIYNYVNQDVKAVFLVMQEVNELAFGVAIKISTACSCPLVAAGSAWTRTKVIKAVKYGVTDILLTPATNIDIEEKIENNHIKLAA